MALITCPECKAQISSSAAACPHCGLRATDTSSGPPARPASPNGRRWALLVGGAVLSASVLIATSILAVRKTQAASEAVTPISTAVPTSPPAAPSTASERATPDPADDVAGIKTYADALAKTKPMMRDDADDLDPGTALLTLWASKSMRFADVGVAKDETTVALIRKDSETERGKRLCGSGSIIEISTEKLENGARVYNGLLMTYASNLIHFFAVGSSGSLVARSDARFCGVVTGRYDYSNSGGGTGHAVQVVGMFDLPENHPRAAAAAATPAPLNSSDVRP